MIILGLDPGLASFGWAILEKDRKSGLSIVDCGVIKTPAGELLGNRLCKIESELKDIIKNNVPDMASIEELFFVKNIKTAMAVSHARGVAILACSRAGLKINEFTPIQVKQALTGYGQADKKQVGFMVQKILKMQTLPKDDNTVDAIALGICLAHSCGVV